jgi:benzoyl-CoA 2,3-dioxygenase component A
MPDDPAADILMVCTGTGSAPFRAFTERRRRAAPGAPGRMLMYFGARTPEELPYFGPLQKVPESLLQKELVFSRVPDRPKQHVQDRMRAGTDRVSGLLTSPKAHVYICGLKGMETGVEAAFAEICTAHGMDWAALKPQMRAEGRYHVETY